MDSNAKAEAIKQLVGNSFIPRKKFDEAKEKSNTAYNELKTEFDNYKASKMTDEEKQAAYVETLKAENKKFKLEASKSKAESIFSGAGLKSEEYSEILEDIVGEDSEKTTKIAESICKIMTSQKEQVKNKITQDIAGNTPKPTAGETAKQGDIDKANTQKQLEEATSRGDYVKMAYYTRLLQEN